MGVGGQTRRAAAAFVVCFLAGCGSLVSSPQPDVRMTELQLDPRPGEIDIADGGVVDPIEVVAGHVAGGDFHLVAYRTGAEPCLYSASPAGSGASCGAMPGEGVVGGGTFGMAGVTAGGRSGIMEVSGLVDRAAESVWVESTAGERFEAVVVDLEPADIGSKAFIAFTPPGSEPEAIVALDADGEVLERFVFQFMDLGGDEPLEPPPAGG